MTKTDLGLAIILVAGLSLVTALVLENAYGLAPCPLCMMQRIWIMIAALVALVGIWHNPRLGIYPLLTLIAALTGAGFSLRQLWLQHLPADQVPSCGPGLEYMIESFPFSDVLRAMTFGTGSCADVVWSFLGLSIPAWALVGFIIMLACAILQWRTR
ncbi:MAG: disulfide bond formation protein B [Gammaproteobacteria bacterium]|nr:disulfide bond formation protein B [Gammaproteobacteria bacterium]